LKVDISQRSACRAASKIDIFFQIFLKRIEN